MLNSLSGVRGRVISVGKAREISNKQAGSYGISSDCYSFKGKKISENTNKSGKVDPKVMEQFKKIDFHLLTKETQDGGFKNVKEIDSGIIDALEPKDINERIKGLKIYIYRLVETAKNPDKLEGLPEKTENEKFIHSLKGISAALDFLTEYYPKTRNQHMMELAEMRKAEVDKLIPREERRPIEDNKSSIIEGIKGIKKKLSEYKNG